MTTLHLETTEDTTTRESIFPVIVASALGSAIEWSDFFYYSFLAVTVFPVVFFPRLDPSTGIAAPLLLGVLRFLQGVGVGGEWGGSVLLTMEFSDERQRGFWTSWPQIGVPAGLALSASSILLFKNLYPGDAFQSIGWR